MLAGAASIDITPPLGRRIQGASVDRIAEFTRDPLEANALYLEGAACRLLLISLDLAVLHIETVAGYCAKIAAATGVPAAAVVIHCTHTHSGPSVWKNAPKDIDEEYLGDLGARLVSVAAEAVGKRVPAQIAWGEGAARLGYNRRLCYRDGSHDMSTKTENSTGQEGPSDPAQFGIFLRDRKTGKLLAVFHSNTSHPVAFYGQNFWSADFPGESRRHLRQVLGEIPVLFFNGSEGDIANRSPYSQPESGDQSCARCAHLLTGETLRLLHEAVWHEDAELGLLAEDLPLAVRLPKPERLRWAGETMAKIAAGEKISPRDAMYAYRIRRLAEVYGEKPETRLPVKALRIGQLGLFAQPSEFYSQFALDIRRRSPAAHTMVCSCCNGGTGYCPTTYAMYTGGYSGEPMIWACLEEMAGYKIVDAACRLLHDLWRQPKN